MKQIPSYGIIQIKLHHQMCELQGISATIILTTHAKDEYKPFAWSTGTVATMTPQPFADGIPDLAPPIIAAILIMTVGAKHLLTEKPTWLKI